MGRHVRKVRHEPQLHEDVGAPIEAQGIELEDRERLIHLG